MKTVMSKSSREFLNKLLTTPSPSGFEQKIQKVVKSYIGKYADDISGDVHGNLIVSANPKGKVRVMLAGHCDQIGFMVTHIDDNGYIYFNQIGGIDPAVVPGCQVTIHTDKGEVDGIVGFKPVHLVPADERGKKVELKKLWIDIGAKNGEEAKKLISVADPITYRLGVTELGKDRIASPACDDKVGVFVAMEALRLFTEKTKGKKSNVALFAVSTVQEELGLRGARTSCFGIDPLVGIAIDVTHASDNPGAEAKEIGTVKLGEGPAIPRGANINPILGDLLVSTAKKQKIAYQPHSAPGATGTDANAIQISRSGVAAALIDIPNRYMHTPVEVVDLRDLTAAAELISETVISITEKISFVP